MAKKTKATKMTLALARLSKDTKSWSVCIGDDKGLCEKTSRASKEIMNDWALRLAFVLNECGSKSERDMAIRKAKVLLETLSGK